MFRLFFWEAACVAVILLLCPNIIFAEDANEDDGYIVIRGYGIVNRSPDDIAQSVTVVKDKDLTNKQDETIGETLSQELGVNSTYFAPGASRPIIRGLGANRVRVLENGIDSLDASSVSDDHAVSIESYTADQIEIFRGPSTLRFGSGAIGGVVNVINKRVLNEVPEKPVALDAIIEHASVSDGTTGSMELNGGANSFAWHADYTYRDSNDYDINGFANEEEREDRGRLKNSDIDSSDNYGFGGAFINDSVIIGLAYSEFESNYGIPGAEEGDIRLDVDQDRYDFNLKFLQPFSDVEQISLRTGYVDYTHDEIEEEGEVATTFENEEWENRLELLTTISKWSTVFGFQYNDKEFSAEGEEAFIAPVDSDRYGLFAVTQREFDKWNIEFGARAEQVDYNPEAFDDEDFNAYSFSLGLIRKLPNDLKLRINLSRSERPPEEVALFADGPHLATLTFERGDSNIDEETSSNFEIGLGQENHSINWQVNAFYNRIDDFIFLSSVDENNDGIADRVDEDGMFVLDGELLLGDYVNEDVEFYGFETEVVSRLIDASYKLDGRIFYDQIRAEARSSGGNLPRIPSRRLGLGLDYQNGRWSSDLDVIFVDDQEHAADLEDETDGYTMVNAGIDYTLPTSNAEAKFFVRGENLLDEDARKHTSFNADRVPLPGIGAKIGLAIKY